MVYVLYPKIVEKIKVDNGRQNSPYPPFSKERDRIQTPSLKKRGRGSSVEFYENNDHFFGGA
jgi:hypothetical protein